jgi:DHA2 family multidrug resistance protein
MNPKFLLAGGIAIAAYSVHLMAQFNLQASFESIIWPRIILGIGMGFLFIPLNTLTMAKIPKEEMGNGTALFNLLRNLGGSFGVALVTTVQAQRAQFHQLRLAEHLSPMDRNLQQVLPQLPPALQGGGLPPALDPQGALQLIYNQLQRQASMLSFNDVFFVLSLLMIFVLPLVLLMQRGRPGEAPTGVR